MDIVSMFVLLLAFVVFAVYLSFAENKKLLIVYLTYAAMLIGNISSVQRFVTRKNVETSMDVRNEYTMACQGIENNCTTDDKVFILSRGDNGFDSLLVSFAVRPITVGSEGYYSPGKPVHQYDIWSRDISPEDLMNKIIDGNYTHVCVQRQGDLAENYGEMFEDIGDLEKGAIFYVDYANRKLIRCR